LRAGGAAQVVNFVSGKISQTTLMSCWIYGFGFAFTANIWLEVEITSMAEAGMGSSFAGTVPFSPKLIHWSLKMYFSALYWSRFL